MLSFLVNSRSWAKVKAEKLMAMTIIAGLEMFILIDLRLSAPKLVQGDKKANFALLSALIFDE
ncbi:hypothetical protein MACH07_26290 [Flagellimonas marinaquae]|uniref:Uncharacterized protein n=1 Tax=Flagellimonas marinaquae TaxID=254955 RepID=A0AA48KM37_9FLAO|nr:hypothetical protein MACH07_26290 [Allomuricauda aquimarina]